MNDKSCKCFDPQQSTCKTHESKPTSLSLCFDFVDASVLDDFWEYSSDFSEFSRILVVSTCALASTYETIKLLETGMDIDMSTSMDIGMFVSKHIDAHQQAKHRPRIRDSQRAITLNQHCETNKPFP